MENASKALLIAAAVLIVILIIAFGMKIFNSTGDTSADAVEVGKSIKEGTTSASSEVLKQSILSKVGSNKTEEEQRNVINSIIKYNEKVSDEDTIYVRKIIGGNTLLTSDEKSRLLETLNYLNGKGVRTIKKDSYTVDGKMHVMIVIEIESSL